MVFRSVGQAYSRYAREEGIGVSQTSIFQGYGDMSPVRPSLFQCFPIRIFYMK